MKKPEPVSTTTSWTTSQKLDRVAMLCDELLRRGVPRDAVQPVVDWLNQQRPSGLADIKLRVN